MSDPSRHHHHEWERSSSAAKPQPSMLIFGFTGPQSTLIRVATNYPEHALIGFDLPAEFDSIAVIAPAVIAVGREPCHREGALALVMTRDGDDATRIIYNDGTTRRATHPQGWILDACLRSVGLATHPAQASPVELGLALWMDRLMSALLRSPVLTWTEAVALCPVPTRWRSNDPAQLGATLATTTPTWRAMRRCSSAGEPAPFHVARAWAAWMDDGMYARWCLGTLPDVEVLRADVEFLASPVVAERVAQAVASARGADAVS